MKLSSASGRFGPFDIAPVPPDALAAVNPPMPPNTLFGRLFHLIGVSSRGNRSCRMQVIETLPLGGRRQVALIACNGRHYLVGCGLDSVTSIVAVPLESNPEQTCL